MFQFLCHPAARTRTSGASSPDLQSYAKIFETPSIPLSPHSPPFKEKNTMLLPQYQAVWFANERGGGGGGGIVNNNRGVYGSRCVKMEKMFKTCKVLRRVLDKNRDSNCSYLSHVLKKVQKR